MTQNFMFANGWGIVHDDTGTHWVYIPLWDPIKFNDVGRAIFATVVIKQHLGAIKNAEAKTMLRGILKDQAQIAATGFSKAMADEGDDWCGTPYPHSYPFGPVGPVDPDGPPIYRKALGEGLSMQIDAKIGLSLLGKLLKNDAISKIAGMI